MSEEIQREVDAFVESLKIHIRKDSLANVNWLLVQHAAEAFAKEQRREEVGAMRTFMEEKRLRGQWFYRVIWVWLDQRKKEWE